MMEAGDLSLPCCLVRIRRIVSVHMLDGIEVDMGRRTRSRQEPAITYHAACSHSFRVIALPICIVGSAET